MENEEMRLKFKSTLDHHLEFVRHRLDESPRHRRNILIWQYGISIAYLLIAGVSLLVDNTTFALVWLGIAVLWLLWYPGHYRRRIVAQNKKVLLEAEKRQGSSRTFELTMTPSGLTIVQEEAKVELAWKALLRVHQLEKFTFLYTSENQAMVLPREDIIEGDYSAFVSRLEEHHKRSLD